MELPLKLTLVAGLYWIKLVMFLWTILNLWTSFISLSPVCEGSVSPVLQMKKWGTGHLRAAWKLFCSIAQSFSQEGTISPLHVSWISCKISSWLSWYATELQNALGWKRLRTPSSSNLPRVGRDTFPYPRLLKVWPWTLPEIRGHPQLLWASTSVSPL